MSRPDRGGRRTGRHRRLPASLQTDAFDRWGYGKLLYNLANAERHLADWKRMLAGHHYGQDSLEYREAKRLSDLAFDRLVSEIRRQILIPVPSIGAMRWKEENRKTGCLDVRFPDVNEAIILDYQRHEAELARLAKRRPRRRGGAS